ncbi:hypothetical protein [Sulfurimonas sp.]|uniref:hypothetical protein n=1 Tax=Sulfurimonas sp. TaxID=2022749 RepID=UPI0025E411AC|nr:hypothetical protein [Sulfurimonas sp.]MBW6488556.1 hypothetical protein [Sulfurimonas sp.]
MNPDEIIKHNLLAEPLSLDALKLARGIYNTHISLDEEFEMEIKIPIFYKLLNLQPSEASINYIQDLLEELNEPLAIRNFEFNKEKTQLKFVQFCCYKIGNESIKIELSEEYLHAQREYMLDCFLF